MIVQRFVRWCGTASSRQRAEGVAILARAFVENRVPRDQTDEALAALTLVLDDPSPKVRLALAEALASSPQAPRRLVRALAEEGEEIGALLAARSPVLLDSDLIDLAAAGSRRLQTAVAARPLVSIRLSAAIAEIGGRAACEALLANDNAAIADVSHRRIAERHGEDAEIRALMLARDDIPVDVRQTLILRLGQALSAVPLVRASLGAARADRLAADACERATAMLAGSIRAFEVPALVEHLRLSGQLSTAFLIRIVCAGNIDLFAAALVALTGVGERRVGAIVVEGREAAFSALIRSAGLPPAAAPVLRTAIQAWRRAVAGRPVFEPADIAEEVMARLVADLAGPHQEPGSQAVEALLRRLEAEMTRSHARRADGFLSAAA